MAIGGRPGRRRTETEEEDMDVGFPLTGLDYVLQAGASRLHLRGWHTAPQKHVL